MFKKDSTAHRVKDFIVSDRFFNIYEDAESKILWTDVDKSHNHLKYYLSDNYIPHSDKKGLLGFLYNISQRLMFVYKRIVLSNQLKESRSVLDYGAGDGKFANYLEKKGKKTFTYDPLKGSSSNSINLHQNTDFQVDMVMMWHVLEHIPDLKKVFPQILERVNKNGFLVIAVPNRDCFDAKYYKNHWAAWDVPRHLYHFNHKSLLNFMSSYGLSFVFKRPLTLDSYYVSYLSEKYKKAPFPLFSGLIIGFLSNFLALFTSNFSSSVYVFQKN
jgi:predicted SAM-dependent methyltransferase